MIFMDKNKRAVSGLLRKKFRTAFITAAFIEFIQIVALTIDSGIVCMLLGKNELAAVGIASPFFFLCGIPAVCLSAGLQTLCSQELGKGDTEKANKYFSATVIFSVIMVSVLTAVLFIAAPHLAFLFGARGNAAGLLELSTVYLKNLAFDAAPFIMLSVLTPVLVLDNDSRTVLASSIAGGITNIAFDILSTKMGWGLCGIGLASAASASVSLLIALTHFLRKDNVIKSRPSEADLRSITEVIRCGLPNAIHSGSGFVRSLVLNSLVVAVGGCAGMSVLTIHSNIIDFADIIAVGIAGAVGVMSGIAFGEMNGEEMEDIGTLAVRYICTVSAVGLSVFLMFSSKAAAFIAGGQTDIRPLLMFALICIGSEIFFNAVIYYRVSYLQAVNENKNAQNLEASANLVFLLMFAFLFSVMFGAYGVFAAFPVSKAAAMAVIYLIYKKKSGRNIPSLRDYLCLNESFFPASKDNISYSVNGYEESALTSEQIQLFCKGHGLEPKKAFSAGLCTEEMLNNIISHGGDSPMIDIRVTIEDEKAVICIKDSGTPFDMKKAKEDHTKKIGFGLKLIHAMADEISYYRLYDTNTTILRV